jgi:hypothetical protein
VHHFRDGAGLGGHGGISGIHAEIFAREAAAAGGSIGGPIKKDKLFYFFNCCIWKKSATND